MIVQDTEIFAYLLLHVKHTQNRKNNIIFAWYVVMVKGGLSLSENC